MFGQTVYLNPVIPAPEEDCISVCALPCSRVSCLALSNGYNSFMVLH